MIGDVAFSYFVSAVLLAAVWFRWGGARPLAIVAALLFTFIAGSAMQSNALGWHLVFTVLLVGFCRLVGGSLNLQRGAAVAALGIAYLMALDNARESADRSEQYVVQLREQYPLQSVSERLAYETARSTAEPVTLSSVVEQNLQMAEGRGRSPERGESIERIYRDEPARSSWGSSFGPGSRRWYGMNIVSLPTPRAISLSEPPPRRGCDPPPEPDYVPSSPEQADSAAPIAAFRQLHHNGAADFLDPNRFGYVQDREHVAGFEPHAFEYMPAMGSHRTSDGEWKLEHLELVSLRKPQGPYVYVSEFLPKLDDLKRADTRLLDDFETRALSQLRTDEDVVVEESGDAVRMLGALRAGSHCIRCHSAQRGELIGAFTYELLKKEPPAESHAEPPPQT